MSIIFTGLQSPIPLISFRKCQRPDFFHHAVRTEALKMKEPVAVNVEDNDSTAFVETQSTH